ncbi:hypothetical protein NL359_32790, partial [Klebsiella pneumoniae]|nr:hypothetical protein [Klebsiella pneumoniae]
LPVFNEDNAGKKSLLGRTGMKNNNTVKEVAPGASRWNSPSRLVPRKQTWTKKFDWTPRRIGGFTTNQKIKSSGDRGNI